MSSYWATSPMSSAPWARRRATVSSTLSTVNMTLRRPSAFGGAIAGSISTSWGLRNFVSSSRPCPSGVRIMTMSTWTRSSPLTRSTHGPSTRASPSSVMPSAVKKAIAAARSSTTTLTWSNLLIVMSLVYSRGRARRSRPTVLASWTWLAEETQGDEGAAKLQEGQMDVSPVLVADLQAPEAVEPGERPFDHPPVASQAVLGLDTTARDAGDDAALAQGQTEVTVVVTLVGMELVRSATGPAARLGADGLDGVDGGEHHLRIVHVRGAHQDRERDAVGVDHKMALRALFAAIRWVLARFLAPPGPAPRRSPARPGPSRCDQPAPDARLVPVSQPAPARHPAPTPHLGRQVLPGDARLQHEQDPRQRRPVRHPGPSALGLRRLRREQRHDPRPQRIRQQFLRHGTLLHGSYSASLAAYATVLLGVLSLRFNSFGR